MDRKRLSDTRAAVTHKFRVGGAKGYLTVGLYDDGKPGEIFVKMHGSEYAMWTNAVSILISLALQSGVPLDVIVSKLENQRGTPAGVTKNEQIPFATSIVDYIAKWLGYQFIPGYKKNAYTVPKSPAA